MLMGLKKETYLFEIERQRAQAGGGEGERI